ncbi:Uncharacterised protein [Bordetella avium]|nr:Uncharacterised protein [Bordetella avium]
MRRALVEQTAPGAAAAIALLIAQMADLARHRLDLLLLLEYQQIEAIQQVFGKAQLDFQLGHTRGEFLFSFHGGY